ncbi:(2Fe-2S)-binding protein [Candidatus Woesearchaeota archaeon]|jgi:ferredoxin|nr:(2Fe-2S)-binding protein [Candidatus Woesearchaeota archaeon]MBT5739748.1 (2Fe-2S)-binding protein [Candidatus Woesearchaeota archaeon]
MAILKFEGKEVEIPDNSPIDTQAEELGIPFSCKDGYCDSCRVKVVSGIENISEQNEREIELELKKTERLACQCKIKTGTVEIGFDLF